MRDAGQSQYRALIERSTNVRSATGSVSLVWQVVHPTTPTPAAPELWVRKLSQKGLEAFYNNALIGRDDVAIAIRWWPNCPIDAKCRFTLQGKIYNVAHVAESVRRSELVLIGQAGANRG